MRTILFCIALFIGGGWLIACNNPVNTDTGPKNSKDTAVLVQDSANTLNAKPINDTTVKK